MICLSISVQMQNYPHLCNLLHTYVCVCVCEKIVVTKCFKDLVHCCNHCFIRTYDYVGCVSITVITDFPLFGNALYGCLMSGSNHAQFCFELGKSGFLCWMLSFLFAGFEGDMLTVSVVYSTM